jgi:hypothetical protein
MRAPPRPDVRESGPADVRELGSEHRGQGRPPEFGPVPPKPLAARPPTIESPPAQLSPVAQFTDEPGPVVVRRVGTEGSPGPVPPAPLMPQQPPRPDGLLQGPTPTTHTGRPSIEALRASYEVAVSNADQVPITAVQTLTRPPPAPPGFQPARHVPARPDARPAAQRTALPVRTPRPSAEPAHPKAFETWHGEPGAPPEDTPASPAEPARRWQGLLAVVAILVVVAGSVASAMLGPAALSRRFHAAAPPGVSEPTPSPLPKFHGPSHLVVLAVRAQPDPFVALIGSRGERAPLAVDVPAQTVLTMPGSGSGTVSDAASGDLGTLSISVGNALGTLPEHGAILSSTGLSEAVDSVNGITVRLLSVETLDGRNVGPGSVHLSGPQVVDYLSINRGFDRGDRWRAVLRGLLAEGVTLREDEVSSTDSLAGMNQVLTAARGALTRPLPTKESEGGLLVPVADQIRGMLAGAFGIQVPKPVPVVVLNGSGAPGIGARVAEKLVPGGFQLVASQNARKFNIKTTTVYANTQDSFPAAERAGRLLGVGAVTLGRSPVSGLSDITIVVGKDF